MKCPFIKIVIYNYGTRILNEGKKNSKVERFLSSTEEKFKDCSGEECMAYRKVTIGKGSSSVQKPISAEYCARLQGGGD